MTTKTKEQEQNSMEAALPKGYTLLWHGEEGDNNFTQITGPDGVEATNVGDYGDVVSNTWASIRELRYENA